MPFRRSVRPFGIVLIGALLAGTALLVAGDILTQLGLKESEARDRVFEALQDGTVPTWGVATVFKALAPAARATLVTSALTWVKAYTESADFASRCAATRDERKPEPPKSGAEMLKSMQDDQKKVMEEARKNLAQLPPDVRAQAEKNIKESEDLFEDPERLKMVKQICDEQAAGLQQEYQAKLARWNEQYPASPKALIALRIRTFLEVSAGVDYNAQLVKREGSMTFADENQERKSREWKLCYRAGKPAVDSARAFATGWLAELEKK